MCTNHVNWSIVSVYPLWVTYVFYVVTINSILSYNILICYLHWIISSTLILLLFMYYKVFVILYFFTRCLRETYQISTECIAAVSINKWVRCKCNAWVIGDEPRWFRTPAWCRVARRFEIKQDTVCGNNQSDRIT